MIPFWFDSPEWTALVKALLHTLWQGTLAAVLLAVALRRLTTPGVRYRSALAALGAVVFATLVTWALLCSPPPHAKSLPPIAPAPTTADLTPAKSDLPTLVITAEPPEQKFVPLHWTAWLALFWLAGASMMLARAAFQVAGAERLRRASRPLDNPQFAALLAEARQAVGLARRVRLAVTDKLTSPVVAGVLVPTLILPLSLTTTLAPEQIRFILLHELAHIRRGDYFANLFQLFAEALLFFNPAVWWISRQVRLEREACCDALAVELSGAPADYARTLVRVVENVLSPASAATPALGDQREPSSLADRVQRMLVPGYRPALRLTWRAMFVALLAGCTLLCLSAAGTRSTIAAILTPPNRAAHATATTTSSLQSAENDSHVASDNVSLATLKGLLDDPNFRTALRVLKQQKTTLILDEPQITVISGRQTALRVENVFENYPPRPYVPAAALAYGGDPAPSYDTFKSPTAPLMDPNFQSNLQAVKLRMGTDLSSTPIYRSADSHVRESLDYKYADPAQPTILSHLFHVNSEWLYSRVQNLPAQQLNAYDASANHSTATTSARAFLTSLGIDLAHPSGKSVEFIEEMGWLIVKATAVDLTAIEQALQETPTSASPIDNLGIPVTKPTGETTPSVQADAVNRSADSHVRESHPAPPVYTGPGRQAIVAKLDKIHLDSVTYDGLPLNEVLKQLSEQCRLHDPEHKGINFLVNNNPNLSSAATTLDPATGLPAAAGAVTTEQQDVGSFIINIPALTDVRLADLLNAIVLVSDHPLKYSAQDFAIVFSAKDPAQPALFMRTFKIDPNTFNSGLENVGAQNFGAVQNNGGNGGNAGGGGGGSQNNGAVVGRVNVFPGAGAVGNSGASGSGRSPQSATGSSSNPNGTSIGTSGVSTPSTRARTYLNSLGVNLENPPGKSVFFNDRLGYLFVKATESDLDTIERALQVLNQVQPQVHVKTRFYETTETNFDQFWNVTNSPNGKKVGILTEPGTRSALRDLPAHATSIGEPEITMLSGRQAQMRPNTNTVTVVTGLKFSEGKTADWDVNVPRGMSTDTVVEPRVIPAPKPTQTPLSTQPQPSVPTISATIQPAKPTDMIFRLNDQKPESEVKALLLAAGVKTPPTIIFGASDGILGVHGTPDQLTLVNRLILKLNGCSPAEIASNEISFAKSMNTQIHLAARFYEVPKEEFKDFGKFLTMKNSSDGRAMGILNGKEAKNAIHELQSRTGFDNLAESEITMVSGQKSQIQTTVQYPQESRTFAPQTNLVAMGSTLGLAPSIILADGYTIHLDATPSLEELLKHDRAQMTPGASPKSTANVNLWDGQTLVLSGFEVRGPSHTMGYPPMTLTADKEVRLREVVVFITATMVDAAGNRIHSDDELPFSQNGIPPQPTAQPQAQVASQPSTVRIRATAVNENKVAEVPNPVVNPSSQPPQSTSPQIHLKARFVEVPQNTLAGGGNAAGTTNSHPATLTGILSSQNAAGILKALLAQKGTQVLAEPEITMLSGRQAQMRTTQVQTIVTNFIFQDTWTNQGQIFHTNAIVPQTSVLECGPILNASTHVLADGYTIELTTTASLTGFFGYAKVPKNITKWVTNSVGEVITLPVTWPAAQVRSRSDTISLYDNQTFVLTLPQKLADQIRFAEPDAKRDDIVAKHIADAQKKQGQKDVMVFITVTLIDPSGNRIHSDNDVPAAKDFVPPQPSQSH